MPETEDGRVLTAMSDLPASLFGVQHLKINLKQMKIPVFLRIDFPL